VRELYEEPCEDRMVTSVEELARASEDCGTQCIGKRTVAACYSTRVGAFGEDGGQVERAAISHQWH
jgi:hypothetical protein